MKVYYKVGFMCSPEIISKGCIFSSKSKTKIMKDVYNELIAALKNNGLSDADSANIAEFMQFNITTNHVDVYNKQLIEILKKVKKAIQQTLINCS